MVELPGGYAVEDADGRANPNVARQAGTLTLDETRRMAVNFAKHSMPNMAFTPSVESWIKLLDQVATMDFDAILPAHGDVATRADVKELAAMLADEYATVKDAVARGVNLDEAVRTLTFPQYRDWRNYGRLQGEIRVLYELVQTGRRSYLE